MADDYEARLRRLVAPEFPELMVLAEEELLNTDQAAVAELREILSVKD